MLSDNKNVENRAFKVYYHLRSSRRLIFHVVNRSGRDPKCTVVKFYNCPNTDGSGSNTNTRISIQVVLRLLIHVKASVRCLFKG